MKTVTAALALMLMAPAAFAQGTTTAPDRTPAQVNPAARHGLLMIGGGNWKEELVDPKTQLKLPGEAQLLAIVAEHLKMPVAILLHVPQQPIFDGMVEDEAISHTFVKFYATGDAE